MKSSLEQQHKANTAGTEPLKNIFSENPLLSLGLAVSPAILYADTVENALILSAVITVLSFLSVMFSSFIPRKIVFTSRVILYTLAGALMFVPIYILLWRIFPEKAASMGIIAPLLITNPFIVSLSEHRFYKKSKGKMTADLITSLLGYDIAVIVFAFIRELFSKGGIGGRLFGIEHTVSGLAYPFGGFILIGLLAAAVRCISSRRAK